MKKPEKVKLENKQLSCLFCNNETFYIHEVRLNKKWLVFFDMEWISNLGKAYICSKCGYKHEFYK